MAEKSILELISDTVDEHMTDENKGEQAEEKEAEQPEEVTEEESEESETEESPQEDEEDEAEETEEDEEDEESSEISKSDLSPEDLKAAQDIYKALKDPNTSKAALKQIADRLGVEVNDKEEPAKEEVDEYRALAEKKLGGNYKFLAEAIGDIIKEVVEGKVKPETEKVRQDVQSAAKQQEVNNFQEVQLDAFLDKIEIDLNGKPPGKHPLIAEMDKIAESYRYTGNLETKGYQTYLGELKVLAENRIGNKTKKIRKAQKINRNIEESEEDSGTGQADNSSGKVTSIRDGIEQALKEVEAEDV